MNNSTSYANANIGHNQPELAPHNLRCSDIGNNGKRWKPGACNTANTPLNVINQMSQILL